MEQQPKPVRLVRETGVGAYTEITVIEAAASAAPGNLVQIRVSIKNKSSSEIGIMVGGALEYGVYPRPKINFPNDWANFPSGASYYFEGSFIMPAYAVAIHAFSYYYGENELWNFDDERTKDVDLAVLQAVFSDLAVTYRGL